MNRREAYPLMSAQDGSHPVGLPGTNAQEIVPVGSGGGGDQLPLEGRQGLLAFADQERIGPVQNRAALRLTEFESNWSRKVHSFSEWCKIRVSMGRPP